jgi:hypothetical protein
LGLIVEDELIIATETREFPLHPPPLKIISYIVLAEDRFKVNCKATPPSSVLTPIATLI